MNDRPGDGQNHDVTEPQRETGGASRLRDCPHKIQEGSEEIPIKVPDQLPATKQLRAENIFVMTEKKAMHQDIRPLKLAIVNLMPTKITTETQLLRLLGNSPLQVEIEFIKMESHESKKKEPPHRGILKRFLLRIKMVNVSWKQACGADIGKSAKLHHKTFQSYTESAVGRHAVAVNF